MALSKMRQVDCFYSDTTSETQSEDMEIVFQDESSSTEERGRKRNRNEREHRARRAVRFMTSVGTQTEPFMMIGRTVCVTGPAVDQRLRYRQEVDGLQTLVDRLRSQLERRQRRVEQLEKEIVEKEVETVACRMRAMAFKTQAEMGEEIIEEFAVKIKTVTEELVRERIDRDRENVTVDDWDAE